jgi:hypothetical protein
MPIHCLPSIYCLSGPGTGYRDPNDKHNYSTPSRTFGKDSRRGPLRSKTPVNTGVLFAKMFPITPRRPFAAPDAPVPPPFRRPRTRFRDRPGGPRSAAVPAPSRRSAHAPVAGHGGPAPTDPGGRPRPRGCDPKDRPSSRPPLGSWSDGPPRPRQVSRFRWRMAVDGPGGLRLGLGRVDVSPVSACETAGSR